MYCPQCRAEYVQGIYLCPDCQVPLTAALPEEEGEAPDDPVVVATEVFNPTEGEIVRSLLQAHGIPCILKAENPYAVDAPYTVGPLARRRILVRSSDLQRAREILRATPIPEPHLRQRGRH
jgi:hypothetical protein